jgi:GT2 family glycosyltransferase
VALGNGEPRIELSDPEHGELDLRDVPGGLGQQEQGLCIRRLAAGDILDDPHGARSIVLGQRRTSSEQVDLRVRIERAGRVEQRSGVRGLRGADTIVAHAPMSAPGQPPISVVIPNWNGRDWLPGCLGAITTQELAPLEVIVVDNGSQDGSVDYLREAHPDVRVLALGCNTGFAHAANRGLEAARGVLVALVNTDVLLEPDWLARMAAVIERHPQTAAVACKMLSLADPTRVYDAGDVLRRDGACEQRGRFGKDDGRWDTAGEVFGACAGAALYRRSAVLELGGFDERYFAYLEDVDLALRLRLAGWRCCYEPAVALHAGEGSSHQLTGGHHLLVTRNTVLLVAKAFPAAWLPFVAYRQLGWAWHALREHRLRTHLRGLAAALPMLPAALRQRRVLRRGARVPIQVAVPARAFRGPGAGGHPAQIAEQ